MSDEATRLRPRKTTEARAKVLIALLIEASGGTIPDNRLDLLHCMAEDALNREAGRAYDSLVRQIEQAESRGAKCPICKRR